jgi:hypothetical protein
MAIDASDDFKARIGRWRRSLATLFQKAKRAAPTLCLLGGAGLGLVLALGSGTGRRRRGADADARAPDLVAGAQGGIVVVLVSDTDVGLAALSAYGSSNGWRSLSGRCPTDRWHCGSDLQTVLARQVVQYAVQSLHYVQIVCAESIVAVENAVAVPLQLHMPSF